MIRKAARHPRGGVGQRVSGLTGGPLVGGRRRL